MSKERKVAEILWNIMNERNIVVTEMLHDCVSLATDKALEQKLITIHPIFPQGARAIVFEICKQHPDLFRYRNHQLKRILGQSEGDQ